jgi:hypothetical protein
MSLLRRLIMSFATEQERVYKKFDQRFYPSDCPELERIASLQELYENPYLDLEDERRVAVGMMAGLVGLALAGAVVVGTTIYGVRKAADSFRR